MSGHNEIQYNIRSGAGIAPLLGNIRQYNTSDPNPIQSITIEQDKQCKANHHTQISSNAFQNTSKSRISPSIGNPIQYNALLTRKYNTMQYDALTGESPYSLDNHYRINRESP